MDLFKNINENDIISDYEFYNEISDLNNDVNQNGGEIKEILNKNYNNNYLFLENLEKYNNYFKNQLGGTLVSPPTSTQATAPTITAPQTNIIPANTTIFVAEYTDDPSFSNSLEKFKLNKQFGDFNREIYNLSYDNFEYAREVETSRGNNLQIHEFKVPQEGINNIAGIANLNLLNLQKTQYENLTFDPIKKKYSDLGETKAFNGLISEGPANKGNLILLTNDSIIDSLQYVNTHEIFSNGEIKATNNLHLK